MSTRSAPEFALSFSSDAVHLMERAGPSAATSVRWREKAVAAFDAPDFRAEMARLRKLAANGPDARVALIIPDDQILYTSLPIAGEVRRTADLGRALDGLTPYPVTDLAWDWRPEGAGDVRVAAVARQTLREAEDFARRHGFAAEGFLADPADGLFPATPQFGDPAWKGTAPLADTDLPGDALADDAMPQGDMADLPTMAAVASAEPDLSCGGEPAASLDPQEEGAEAPVVMQAVHADNATAPAADAAGLKPPQEGPQPTGGSQGRKPVKAASADAAVLDGADAEPGPSSLPSPDAGQATAGHSASMDVPDPAATSGEDGVDGSLRAVRPANPSADGGDHAEKAGDPAQAVNAPAAGDERQSAATSPEVPAAGRASPDVAAAEAAGDEGMQGSARAVEAGGVAIAVADDLPPAAKAPAPDDKAVQPAAPPASSKLVADRAAPPRPVAPPPDRARAVLDRAAAARGTRAEPAVLPDRHPGARGGIGALLVMLGALLLGLTLIWAFATPEGKDAPAPPATVATTPASAMPQPPAEPPQEADRATTPAATRGDSPSVPVLPAAQGHEGEAAQGGAAARGQPAGTPPVAETVRPAAGPSASSAAGPTATVPAVPETSTVAAGPAITPVQPAADATATVGKEEQATATPAASANAASATDVAPRDQQAGSAQPADSARATAPPARDAAPAVNPPKPAETQAAAGAIAPVAPSGSAPSGSAPVAAAVDSPATGSDPAAQPAPAIEPPPAQAAPAPAATAVTPPASTRQGAAPPASVVPPSTAAARPSNAPRRPAQVAAPSASQVDQLPAVVPGRRALTRSERPSSRPAAVRAQPARIPAAEPPAATARPATTTNSAAAPSAPRPTAARPEAAPRAAVRPAATSKPPASSTRPRPRPEEGSADESVTATEMTAEERIAADLMLADLHMANPWLPRFSGSPAAYARGPRFAEARPSRRPAAGGSAVDAAIAEAVAAKPVAAQGDRPVKRASGKPVESKPAATQASVPVKAAANTKGRPVARPGRSGSKPSSAVQAALAEAVGTDSPDPAKLASAASLVPVRKPARAGGSAPAGDAQAEAVALAAATALRPRPDPAPAAAAPSAPVASAQPAPGDAAQRLRDEELQRQAEERARQRAQSDAQAEMQARAAAEARARAQAEAEERAAIAARGSYRPPEIDDEPEVAQKPAEGRTSGDVAKNATLRGIETGKTQVIGVIGAGRASRGLIRLRNGKVVTVRLGDRIDGGAINSIGNGKISYVKGGRTYNLPILNGR